MYDIPTDTWIHGCILCEESVKFTSQGMNITTCVDSCIDDLNLAVSTNNKTPQLIESLALLFMLKEPYYLTLALPKLLPQPRWMKSTELEPWSQSLETRRGLLSGCSSARRPWTSFSVSLDVSREEEHEIF